MSKTSQLQLRISPAQKAAIRRKARSAGMNVSEWVLAKVLPASSAEFEALVTRLAHATVNTSHVLAAINDLLEGLPPSDFEEAVSRRPPKLPSGVSGAYVAAMVELAAHQRGRTAPSWTAAFGPLEQPYFASDLVSLRAHLLRASPVPFRRRNIFVDASLGERV